MTSRIAKLAARAGASAMLALLPFTALSAQDLTGAGATFPDPIYKKWIADYSAKAHVQINYQAIGSGGGIKQLTEQTVDFGASDAPMSDEEMSKLKAPVFHIPMVLGSVVITYNLPEVTKPLHLTGAVIADIFTGKITKWNAPQIVSLNKGVSLPNKDILVVHRAEASGTTYIFSDYLSNVSPTWKSGPSTGKELKWPVGLGGKGNDGVTGQVKQTPGAIGYVELAYARQNKLPFAAIQNKQGEFVLPSIESTTAAGAGVASGLPANTDFRLSLVNAPGKGAYPISSMTFILLYQTQMDAAKGKKLIDFLKWALHDGQADAPSLDYAPLPKNVVTMLDKRLSSVKFGM
jgi:phosphate transport system substrate-binding protein